MVILGINASHTATACLFKDGRIVSCLSEERLTRVKSQSGLPVLAAKEVLKIAGLRPEDIDYVALGFRDSKINNGFSVLNYSTQESKNKKLGSILLKLGWKIKEEILVRLPNSRDIIDLAISSFYKLFLDRRLEQELDERIEKEIGVSKEKIVKVDHHTAHAYSAYFSSPDYLKERHLVLTLDAMGDDLCATVNIGEKGRLKRIASTPFGNSIGDLYAQVTAYMGMKMGEHEYKVMGLAPYANESHVERVYQKLKGLVWVNKDLTFTSKIHSHMFYKILPKVLANERFDNIAGAIQRLAEELMTSWVKMSVKKTGINKVDCAGGVFMNVKANQKILELNEVKKLFVMPSCGDESTAIGAAYWVYEMARRKSRNLKQIIPLGLLYFGGEFSESDISKEIAKKEYGKYKAKKFNRIERKIADLLSQGKIVARFAGRMEWGARALGNRSILSHPANLDAIRVINDQIKSRDFWMPFAPVIMKERESKYIINPKRMSAPYMIVTFASTKEGKDKFKAAMHQYDFTLRPQIINKDWNYEYWLVLKEFEKITGIGGVLNTSFNLHGFPIVYSPKDALDVFKKSDLQYLALGRYLVSKS